MTGLVVAELRWSTPTLAKQVVPSANLFLPATTPSYAIAKAITLNGTGVSSGGALRNRSPVNQTWSREVNLGSAARMNSDSATLTLSGGINGAGKAPTVGGAGNITVTPAGQTATFMVVASNAASDQWRKNSVNLTNGGNISGATSSTLAIANAQSSDAGSCTVVVTNPTGSVTSQVAQLVVP
jgi:hypothetical protein